MEALIFVGHELDFHTHTINLNPKFNRGLGCMGAKCRLGLNFDLHICVASKEPRG